MDVNAYCDGLTVELNGWKAKVGDIVQRLDKMPSGDKEKVVPQVNELHALIEELDDRVERLKRECPTEWEPDKIELESKVERIQTAWEDVWQNVSPADFGG
jgi:predicted nuclease with TOPRIM domain